MKNRYGNSTEMLYTHSIGSQHKDVLSMKYGGSVGRRVIAMDWLNGKFLAGNTCRMSAQVKDWLRKQGVDLTGPCGAFAITKRVAWGLRGTGAGLLSKPAGNNCEGFATDIIAFADGRIVDILGDGGNANIPGWNHGEPVDATRFRPAINPD